jgi:hypothetical protein
MAGYYFDQQNDSDRDYPLIPEWRAPGMAEALGLKPAQNAGHERVRDIMLANLRLAADSEKALSYSRHKGSYARSRYLPADLTFANVVRVAAELVEAELADENRTLPGHRGWQSTLIPLPALISSQQTDMDHPIYDQHGETIILRSRSEDRALLEYDDTRRTHGMRMQVAAIREMHASTLIGITDGIRVGNHLLFERLDTDEYGNPVVKRQYVRVVPGNGGRRIFSENWRQHGRYYCWMQNIPSAARATMTINGQPVAEPDYSAMHPTLLYNKLGKKLDGDPYDIGDGFDRTEVKIGVVIAINAQDDNTAVKALARDRRISHERARKIIAAIRHRHKPIEGAICSDAGIGLMNLDSEIAMAVTTGLMADGIPSIPVHDSVIVPVQYRGHARAKMEECWASYSGQLNPCRIN